MNVVKLVANSIIVSTVSLLYPSYSLAQLGPIPDYGAGLEQSPSRAAEINRAWWNSLSERQKYIVKTIGDIYTSEANRGNIMIPNNSTFQFFFDLLEPTSEGEAQLIIATVKNNYGYYEAMGELNDAIREADELIFGF